MTISPLRDSETLRQQKNLTTTQKRANTETREGVLVNNFINTDKVNLEDTCDTLVISKSSKMPSRLYENNNQPEKSIIPISAVAVGVMGIIALLSAFVKRNTRINLKISDEKRLPATTRNVALNEETHQALYQMIQSPTRKTIHAGVGVLTLSAMAFMGKTFFDGFKDVWVKKREADIQKNMQEQLISIETQSFAGKIQITRSMLSEKAKEFRDKDIPVRWFILDDMWGDVPSINRQTMHSRELYRFEADGKRFEKGLKGVIKELRDVYGIETGIWHPTTGYWNGIDPAGEIAQNHKDLLVYSAAGKLVHSPETAKAFEYYNIQHSFYRECGATFVKVDNQGFLRTNYKNIMPIGKAAENVHKAIEASVGANFDMEMINCMCMPSECFWNRPTSSVCRFSGDFQPMDRQWFIRHILQGGYYSLFQGCVY